MGILDGKTAFVTGAAQGIGRGIAAELATAGARVVLTYLEAAGDACRTHDLANELSAATDPAFAVPLDVTDKRSVVVFLASPWASNITGQSFNVDGGLLMS